jgi:branched-chain amino acid transport system substrate-binding protein
MKTISYLNRYNFIAVIALVAVLAFVSCKKSGGPGGDTIRVGEFASLTGGTATFGQSVHQGDVLAINEINAAGGVLGKQIDLMTEDDQSKTEDAVASVQKLVNSDRVVAVLGEVASSRSMAGAPICQLAHVPMITPASTNEDVTKKGDYIFRICFTDPFQGQTMARFAMNSLGKKRAAILTDVKQDYSVGLDDAFKNTYTFGGGTIVSEQSYSSGDKDFHAALTSIKGANPEVIFVPGYYTEVALIVRQARELGIDCPILGGDGWDSPELTKGNEQQFNNTFFSNHFSTEDPDTTVQSFIKKYQDLYHAVPDAMAALGYDAARILADAMIRAHSTDSTKLMKAISSTTNFPGVTGNITIDKYRNASKPITIIKIKDGKFHFAQRIGPNGEAMTPFAP